MMIVPCLACGTSCPPRRIRRTVVRSARTSGTMVRRPDRAGSRAMRWPKAMLSDCIALLDPATEASVRGLGGLAAIAAPFGALPCSVNRACRI